ncbi:30S ribosomal protein S4 [Agathobaculum sp. NSJ-28]|uniref:Small ribosomal subunit protein uS4 n=2 Tax=Agathobaculum TaxID=2048137 RepID=A0A923RW87_9FIRM|nr:MULTISPECIES: 30S ribosomal protein S4 [Butyricicoccaceae]MBS6882431.1 30S ribosomal protein S4 [Clostridiaceae bacterium]SCJ46685.1 30S ribosomal protein S4 [uncultured Butyricicoccus sp.]MBC5725699.1 30S ribosomal protein S4 [Agathobaculum faecis]MCU6790005.1 30S ribosomal protein S4 [Agathobaculum ammoniilyticum]WOC74965.1 30S ribosomal protein S4 [Intestinibacillus sp. NTUH-41-i26]
MAKNTQPVLKRCKTLGLSPAVLGYSKSTKRQPKQSRRKQSEYGMQLNEKQKVKFIYGVLEKQFHAYYEKAERKQGITGEILLQELERRLDNVVFRMGFANTRREARQLVNHAHFTVNGKRVNIPSYQVKPGDVVAVCEKSRSSAKFKTLLEENGKKQCPKWIDKAKDSFEGRIASMPARDDIDYDVSEHLIVELYSK